MGDLHTKSTAPPADSAPNTTAAPRGSENGTTAASAKPETGNTAPPRETDYETTAILDSVTAGSGRGAAWRQRRRRPRRPPPRRNLLLSGLIAGGLALVLIVVAVAGLLTGEGPGGVLDGGEAAPPPEPVEPVQVIVSPADAAAKVRLDATIRVAIAHGQLTQVEVATADGTTLEGLLAVNGRSWESTGTLAPGASYQVTWTADDEAGEETTGTSSFTTLTPKGELSASVAPLEGETVGVGQPIMIFFNHPVTNKAAVERALEVETSREVVGAWRWFGDDEVRFRPREYWPAHTEVRLNVNIAGVDAGGGIWGVEGRSVPFTVGRRQISTADARTHQMTVKVDGKVVRTLPISMGRPEFATRNGIHTILSLERRRIMDSDTVGLPGAYRLEVEYALRLTNSGEFVHSAPWSVGAQGNANVSHGCINLSPENAAWFFEMSQRGDLVEVVGSTAGPEPIEGLIEWNQSFEEWKQGSALLQTGEAVRIG